MVGARGATSCNATADVVAVMVALMDMLPVASLALRARLVRGLQPISVDRLWALMLLAGGWLG